MKKYYYYILFTSCWLSSNGQHHKLTIFSKTEIQQSVIDSIGYQKKHLNRTDTEINISSFFNKLLKLGYLNADIVEKKMKNDSIMEFEISLGEQTRFAHIYIGKDFQKYISKNYSIQSDTLTIQFNQTDVFLETTMRHLEKNGLGFSKIKLNNIVQKKQYLTADLNIILEEKRFINNFLVKGFEDFPDNYLSYILKKYQGKILNQDNLKLVYNDFNKIGFARQLKFPEVLFSKKESQVYVYLEKAKTNTFDGFIGFENDENKHLNFNGYLDLSLQNILNKGEKLDLNWKNDGKSQQNFNISISLPYVFKTALVIKTDLSIFKQDSLFQNTKTNLNIGYMIKPNLKIAVGIQATESNDLKKNNTYLVSEFKNNFTTANIDFFDIDNSQIIFLEKSKLNFNIGFGKRSGTNNSVKQFFAGLLFKYRFKINTKNAISLKSENYFLKSNQYLSNELYRFGGIKSIRGFQENSLQANILTSIMTEYQFEITPNFYIHTISDYGFYQDDANKTNQQLIGLGVGLGLITKNGLLNINFANGTNSNQNIQFSNAVVHIGMKTNF